MSMPYRQDMPPAGGFETVKYKRNLPMKGPGAYAILGGVTAICAYGFYRLGKGNLERSPLDAKRGTIGSGRSLSAILISADLASDRTGFGI
ncbi:hypothetical protein AX15_007235 [Amanita polypyramis BW_CC]|nr:hypothetical protein AX15_007235 [Amanita polypyramis BW_CC]